MNTFWSDPNRKRVAGDLSPKMWVTMAKDCLARGIVALVASLVWMWFAGSALAPLMFSGDLSSENLKSLIIAIILVFVSGVLFSYAEFLIADFFKSLKMSQLATAHPRVSFESLRFDGELLKKWRLLFRLGGYSLQFLFLFLSSALWVYRHNYIVNNFNYFLLLFTLVVCLAGFLCSYPSFDYVRIKAFEWSRETEDCANHS